MRIPRIFQNQFLEVGHAVRLDNEASHYVKNVLRLQKGDRVILFNGNEKEFEGTVEAIQKKEISILLKEVFLPQRESPLKVSLAQAISRGEKMDFTLQKAVELGVHTIVPLLSERVGVKWDSHHAENRLAHWHKVIVSAAEQSGRVILPSLLPIQPLDEWIKTLTADLKIFLDPHGQSKKIPTEKPKRVVVLVGPEGGFTPEECEKVKKAGFIAWHLGPRILRTETAGLSAVSILQYVWGDLQKHS